MCTRCLAKRQLCPKTSTWAQPTWPCDSCRMIQDVSVSCVSCSVSGLRRALIACPGCQFCGCWSSELSPVPKSAQTERWWPLLPWGAGCLSSPKYLNCLFCLNAATAQFCGFLPVMLCRGALQRRLGGGDRERQKDCGLSEEQPHAATCVACQSTFMI